MASTDNGVANTILQQLGGRKFIVMTGANNFLGDTNFLMFSLPSTRDFVKDKINKVRIILDQNDTYTVEFLRITKRKGMPHVDTIKKVEGVYCDVLQQVFTRHTGLATRI